MKSVGLKLDQYGGVGHGFDFLRLFLALSVVGWHGIAIVYGSDAVWHNTALWIYKFSVLPMFFALSGFLITGSATRLRLRDFLVNRGLRIIPALAVEIGLSAIILGPLFTTVSLPEYFSDHEFRRYFLNITGYIHYDLPGVFRDNPRTQVNGSLWTIPYEIGCYIIMSALIILGVIKKPKVILFLIAAYFVGSLVYTYTGIRDVLPSPLGRMAAFAFKADPLNLSGPSLTLFFLGGCLAFLWRHKIPYHFGLFFAALGVIVLLALVGDRTWELMPQFQLVACALFVYLVLFIGASNVWMPTFLKKNDLSYGIYLYGWPIQQSVISLYRNVPNAIVLFALVVPPLVLFAAFSWTFIERPILRQRKNLSFLARRVQKAEEEAAAAPALLKTGFRNENERQGGLGMSSPEVADSPG